MKYKAVIFDCDGTLLWTIDDLRDATNFALQKLGYQEKSIDDIMKMVGNGIGKLVSLALGENNQRDYEKAMKYFQEYYTVHYADKTTPYPGILDMLLQLKNLGIKMAVVSNKKEEYLLPLFEKIFNGIFSVVIGEQATLDKKPAPDMVNFAITQLGVEKQETVYVGDSEVDIKTALNSRIDMITVSWGFRSKEILLKNGASVIVDTPSEIIDIIKS